MAVLGRWQWWHQSGGDVKEDGLLPAERWWQVVPAWVLMSDSGGSQKNPETEHFCSVSGLGRQAVGSHAHVRNVLVEVGRRGVEPQKWAVVLSFGVRGMVMVARECQNPKNEHVLLIFRVRRLVVSQLYIEWFFKWKSTFLGDSTMGYSPIPHPCCFWLSMGLWCCVGHISGGHEWHVWSRT